MQQQMQQPAWQQQQQHVRAACMVCLVCATVCCGCLRAGGACMCWTVTAPPWLHRAGWRTSARCVGHMGRVAAHTARATPPYHARSQPPCLHALRSPATTVSAVPARLLYTPPPPSSSQVTKYEMSEADYSARDNTYRKYKEEKLKEDPSWTLEKEMAMRRGGQGGLGRGRGRGCCSPHRLSRLPPSSRLAPITTITTHTAHMSCPQVSPTPPQRRWAPTTWQQRQQHSSRASAAAWSQGSGEERSSETRTAGGGAGGGGHTAAMGGGCTAQHHRLMPVATHAAVCLCVCLLLQVCWPCGWPG